MKNTLIVNTEESGHQVVGTKSTRRFGWKSGLMVVGASALVAFLGLTSGQAETGAALQNSTTITLSSKPPTETAKDVLKNSMGSLKAGIATAEKSEKGLLDVNRIVKSYKYTRQFMLKAYSIDSNVFVNFQGIMMDLTENYNEFLPIVKAVKDLTATTKSNTLAVKKEFAKRVSVGGGSGQGIHFDEVKVQGFSHSTSHPPKNAIDGDEDTYAEVTSDYWKGDWFSQGQKKVSSVEVSTPPECNNCVSQAKIYIEDSLCGRLPKETEGSETYTVECKRPLSGTSVEVVKYRTAHGMKLASVVAYEDGQEDEEPTASPELIKFWMKIVDMQIRSVEVQLAKSTWLTRILTRFQERSARTSDDLQAEIAKLNAGPKKDQYAVIIKQMNGQQRIFGGMTHAAQKLVDQTTKELDKTKDLKQALADSKHVLDQDFTEEGIKENLGDEFFAEDYAEQFEEGLDDLITQCDKLLKENNMSEKKIQQVLNDIATIS